MNIEFSAEAFICLVCDCICMYRGLDWKGGGEHFSTSNKFISSSKSVKVLLLLNNIISSHQEIKIAITWHKNKEKKGKKQRINLIPLANNVMILM